MEYRNASWFATETNVRVNWHTNRCYGHHIFITWPLSISSASLSCPAVFRALVVIDIARYICCLVHVLVDRRRWNIERLIISWRRKTWRRSRGWLYYRPYRCAHFKGCRRSPCRKRILWRIILAVTAARTHISFWWSLLILSLGTERITTATIFRQTKPYILWIAYEL